VRFSILAAFGNLAACRNPFVTVPAAFKTIRSISVGGCGSGSGTLIATYTIVLSETYFQFMEQMKLLQIKLEEVREDHAR
jgi:hypothetical protein